MHANIVQEAQMLKKTKAEKKKVASSAFQRGPEHNFHAPFQANANASHSVASVGGIGGTETSQNGIPDFASTFSNSTWVPYAGHSAFSAIAG